MSRLAAIQPQAATSKRKKLLDAVQAKLKITPNMTKVMASSPAVLEAYLSFNGALANGPWTRSCATRLPWQWVSRTPVSTAYPLTRRSAN